jgi:hypothetical protein
VTISKLDSIVDDEHAREKIRASIADDQAFGWEPLFARARKLINETMQENARQSYATKLEEHRLRGWQQQVEQLAQMNVDTDTLQKMYEANKSLEAELNSMTQKPISKA